MSVPDPHPAHCPHCDTVNPAIEERCRECGGPLAASIGPPVRVRRIGLGGLMLLIAEVAVCLAVMRAIPVLGVVLLLVLLPAQVRTLVAAARRKAAARPMTLDDVLETFLVSVFLMLLIGLAAGIAFGVTCFVGGWGGVGLWALRSRSNAVEDALRWGFTTGVPLGAIAALAVIVLLLRRSWDMKD